MALDVTDTASLIAVAEAMTNGPGRLDLLINNAGIHYDTQEHASNAELDGIVAEGRTHRLPRETREGENAPVLSATLSERRPLRQLEDLYDHTVLLSRQNLQWDIWLKAHGLERSRLKTRQLRDYNVVLQAAADGQGVAMGRRLTVGDRVTSGVLKYPSFPFLP